MTVTSISVTLFAEDRYERFGSRLTPTGLDLLDQCAVDIVKKLFDPNYRHRPSPTLPGTFVVHSMALWFAWYRFVGVDSIEILQFHPRTDVPTPDRRRLGVP